MTPTTLTDTPTKRAGTARVGVRVVAVVGGMALLFALIGLPLFAFPYSQPPAKADAVVVLGPATTAEMAVARHLVEEGYAPTSTSRHRGTTTSSCRSASPSSTSPASRRCPRRRAARRST